MQQPGSRLVARDETEVRGRGGVMSRVQIPEGFDPGRTRVAPLKKDDVPPDASRSIISFAVCC